jgi:iron complex transport system permease protein
MRAETAGVGRWRVRAWGNRPASGWSLRAVVALLGVLLLLTMAIATTRGAVTLTMGELVDAVRARLTGQVVTDMSWSIIWAIRVPRVLLTVLVGAVLAVSGATLQGLFRNPLSDPGLIGVSSGAALATAAVVVLGGRWLTQSGVLATWIVAGAGFAGGLAVAAGLLAMVRRHGTRVSLTLVLGGVALNAFAGAGTGALTMLATDQQLRSITFWTLGGLGGATWPVVAVAAVPIGLSVCMQLRAVRTLDLLLLGEREAAHLGVDVARVTRAAVVWAALGVGAAVAFAGGIGFVGLVVPHLARMALGASHRVVMPVAALGGSTLLLLADTVARTVVAPVEIPVGVMTALLGAPLLLVLLVRQLHGRGAGHAA